MYKCNWCKKQFESPDYYHGTNSSEYFGQIVTEYYTERMCPFCGSYEIEIDYGEDEEEEEEDE